MRYYQQGLCLALLVLITTLQIARARTSTASRNINKYARQKRQAGDIVLMGYNAQKALKGTTRQSDFFQRIGKSWIGSPGFGDSNIVMRSDSIFDKLYEDSNYLEEEW